MRNIICNLTTKKNIKNKIYVGSTKNMLLAKIEYWKQKNIDCKMKGLHSKKRDLLVTVSGMMRVKQEEG